MELCVCDSYLISNNVKHCIYFLHKLTSYMKYKYLNKFKSTFKYILLEFCLFKFIYIFTFDIIIIIVLCVRHCPSL